MGTFTLCVEMVVSLQRSGMPPAESELKLYSQKKAGVLLIADLYIRWSIYTVSLTKQDKGVGPLQTTACTLRAGALLYNMLTEDFSTQGTTVRPMVIFTPDGNKIFTGESITLKCYMESLAQGNLAYTWYKDGDWVHTGKSYTIQQAQHSHSGNYQCQTSSSDRSDSARLDVCSGYVILQAPLHVYEGDNVTLRCNHSPGHATKQTVFYKDDEVIQDWALESELLIENVDAKSVHRYKCTKQVYHHLLYYHHTDEVTFFAQELFTHPVIRLTEGDHMTLTCETSLNPLRKTTELQFAFYKDGDSVQNYSHAGRLSIPSAWMKKYSGYTCEVRTLTNTVEKTSIPFHVEAKEHFDSPEIIETTQSVTPHPVTEESIDTSEIIVTPHPVPKETNNLVSILPVTLMVVLLLLVAISFFMYKRKQVWLSVNNQQQITVFDKEDNVEFEDTYAVSEVLHTPQISQKSFSHPPGYSKVPDLENA